MSEPLTVLDDHGLPAGTADRETVHRDGLWHAVFHCLVVRTSLPARVVLQRRRREARGFPGLLDLSATGHLVAGETPLEGIRELREELGIDVEPSSLVPLGRRRLVDDSGEGRNREIAHVYLLADDRPLDAFPVDRSEVDGLVELRAADLLAVLHDPGARIGASSWDGAGVVRPIEVSAADLVPDIDGYWTVLTVMAERFAAGKQPLAI